MALKPYQSAILTVDFPAEGLHAGDVGTIVDEHVVPGVSEKGYSVEFFDMTGRTVAVVTVPASNLREPTPADRPSVRVLSGSTTLR
jgi:Domain of unknown function (DUF4926)